MERLTRAPVAAITAIHADTAGVDRRNLNDEYAVVRNTGTAQANILT